MDFKNVILNSSKYKILLNPLDYYEKKMIVSVITWHTKENIKTLKEFLIKVTLRIFQQYSPFILEVIRSIWYEFVPRWNEFVPGWNEFVPGFSGI